MPPRNRQEMAKLLAYGQIGLEMAAPIGLGVFLDLRLDTVPWLTVAGAVVGLVGGLTHLIALMIREERQTSGK
jgi:F0F1-type ATP synthase assembly protein I